MHIVVHCVRVSLIGTTVAPSWASWSLVGDWFCTINTHFVTLLWEWGPSKCCCNGSTPWQCSQGHLVHSIYRLCNLFSGDSCLRVSLSLPKVLGSTAPFGGNTTIQYRWLLSHVQPFFQKKYLNADIESLKPNEEQGNKESPFHHFCDL